MALAWDDRKYWRNCSFPRHGQNVGLRSIGGIRAFAVPYIVWVFPGCEQSWGKALGWQGRHGGGWKGLSSTHFQNTGSGIASIH